MDDGYNGIIYMLIISYYNAAPPSDVNVGLDSPQ